MVVGAFPIAKLGTLLLKQISKPIANALKNQAKNSPTFGRCVCLPPAQFYNWCEIKAKMWILNLGKPVNIAVLNEESAIELGANLLGEFIIFTVAAAAVVFEYNRSARKEAAKEAARIEEIQIMNKNMQELFFKTEEQSAQIRELMRIVSELDMERIAAKKFVFYTEAGVVKKPWIPKKKQEELELPPKESSPPSGFIPIPVPVHPEKDHSNSNSKSNSLNLHSADTKLLLIPHSTIPPKVPNSLNLNLQNIPPSVVPSLKTPYLKSFPPGNMENSIKTEDKLFSSFLLQVVHNLENEFFGTVDESRQNGILSNALNYLYQEVYRLPLSL